MVSYNSDVPCSKLTVSSYNRINGTAACESDPAMNQILKKELNFQGL